VGQLSGEVVTGLSVKKGVADPPLLPDGDYPAWLWGLLEPPPTTAELQRKYEKEGLTLAEVRGGSCLRHPNSRSSGNTSGCLKS
jgi:large subunit ribosomal protein L54